MKSRMSLSSVVIIKFKFSCYRGLWFCSQNLYMASVFPDARNISLELQIIRHTSRIFYNVINHIPYKSEYGATQHVINQRGSYGSLTRYVKLQVAHAPGIPGAFSPAADFKGNRYLAIPACITARASRTCRDACRDRLPAVAGKTFPAFPAHAHPQFYVSGKRPMAASLNKQIPNTTCSCLGFLWWCFSWPKFSQTLFEVRAWIIVYTTYRTIDLIAYPCPIFVDRCW